MVFPKLYPIQQVGKHLEFIPYFFIISFVKRYNEIITGITAPPTLTAIRVRRSTSTGGITYLSQL
jgi:hypothetical protein